jgi:DNA polymerase elongation subunit (family B)
MKPVITMFGATESGNSIAVHVHNFRPYFYSSKNIVNSLIPKMAPGSIEKTEIETKTLFRSGSELTQEFCKVTLNHSETAVDSKFFEVYEKDVPFELRFMMDAGISSMSWIKLEDESWTERADD